jgi:YihY family inner membrane protein
MQAQDAFHNPDSSSPPSPQGETAQPGALSEETTVHEQIVSSERDPDGTKTEETTVKVTVEQVDQQLLVKKETDISVELTQGAEAVSVTKQETERLIVDTGEHIATRIIEAEKMISVAEADVHHLLLEAETHETVKVALGEAKTFGEFWLKFLNDWVLNFSSGLAYNLLMAMFPIIIALGATLGLVSGNLDMQKDLIDRLSALFPSVLGQDVLKPALSILHKDAGFLGVLAIVLALYSGSRLFVAMENYFALIYHTAARPYWRKNLMALVMLLIFIVLIPIMLFASSIGLSGFLGGLIASLLLFEAIYMIVPNQHISLSKSWRGALVAAVALQIYVAIFPLYIRSFLGSYTGNTGFAIILLLFFYYFAVILLIGAEVNAFYGENVRARPESIDAMVHAATLEADRKELEELARQKIVHHTLKR